MLKGRSSDPVRDGGGLGGLLGGGGGGGMGNLGIAGISALLGKMAYDSAKDRMGGLAATPAVTMDSLGRYSLSKALGTGGTREEFGLPAAQESLKFNMGGPVYGYGYGGEARQYFNQGGLAELNNDGYITITKDMVVRPPYGRPEANISETKLNLFERKQEIMDLLEDKKIRKKISTSKIKKLNEELRAIDMELAGNFNQGMTRNARKNNESMRNALKSLRTGAAMGGLQELDMRDGGESEGPGTGTSDDIPAMLSDGEFVMTAAATKGAGAFNLNKTKSGIELISGGKSSRKKGVENMRELMNIFEAI
jgi:hypothetical protein